MHNHNHTEILDEECPQCGSNLLQDRYKDKRCSDESCDYVDYYVSEKRQKELDNISKIIHDRLQLLNNRNN